MKLLSKAKDGGPESTVTGYWLIELKSLFSVVLLRFDNGSRSRYHDHAFDSLNWVVNPNGTVVEHYIVDPKRETRLKKTRRYRWSLWPILTRRSRMHRVVSEGTTWVFSLRGPWSPTWHELDTETDEVTTLTHGRRVVDG